MVYWLLVISLVPEMTSVTCEKITVPCFGLKEFTALYHKNHHKAPW